MSLTLILGSARNDLQRRLDRPLHPTPSIDQRLRHVQAPHAVGAIEVGDGARQAQGARPALKPPIATAKPRAFGRFPAGEPRVLPSLVSRPEPGVAQPTRALARALARAADARRARPSSPWLRKNQQTNSDLNPHIFPVSSASV